MLIEFNAQNFRSIKEKVTLSLVASSDKSLIDNLIETDTFDKDRLLKSAVIYGPNASGKSNVVLAISYLKKLIMESHKVQKGNKIGYFPFKLDEKYLLSPTKFDVVFIKNNIKYIYGVSFDSDKIIDEYLYYYPKGRKSIIFERNDTNNYKFTTDKKTQKFISEKTLDNVLYLSNSTHMKYGKTSEAFQWFDENLRLIIRTNQNDIIKYTANILNKNKKLSDTVLKALVVADLGIDGVYANFSKVSLDELPSEIASQFKSFGMPGDDTIEKIDIKTIHKILDENGDELQVEFDFDEESEGTKRLFSLIGPFIDVLDNGRILVVDELDNKLHHFLSVFLIELFHDSTQNQKNAQLIFTTHNTNLIDLDLFRRDQIWFTEKIPNNGSTDFYSLVEFSPRKDKNIQKGYLAGRYGAIPFISDEGIF